MSKPRTGHMMQLKRVARYLKGVLRKAQLYPTQESDSDWARDTMTRPSTSGVIGRRGRHLLRHSSTVQNVSGLSSAESEYYALTKRGCSELGLQSLVADWNLELQLSHCVQILRARKQLLREEELARAPVTYRRGCCGCKNV